MEINHVDQQIIIEEIRKINQQLANIKSNTSKTNVAFGNFLAGLFHSIGNLIGISLMTLALIYISSRFGWDKMLLDSTIKTFSQLLPGQP